MSDTITQVLNEQIPNGKSSNKDDSPIIQNPDVYNKKINAQPTPQPKIGVDVDGDFLDVLLSGLQQSKVDLARFESFSSISQGREQVYTLLDSMSEDAIIAAALETYTEDATETNTAGRIVWVDSLDPRIAKYVTYLLDTMNIDKNAYKWVYSLVKYGDLYLRLYRESDYNDKLFETDDATVREKHKKSQQLHEQLNSILSHEDEILADLNACDSIPDEIEANAQLNENLNEDVNLRLYDKNDKYIHYLEMIPNPAEIYELTRLGKTYAYIQAPVTVNLRKSVDSQLGWNRMQYNFKRKDVIVYEATEFVHAALEDNSSRAPEEVKIFLSDQNLNQDAPGLTYTVRRGQSILYTSYKIWRELMLLEYSLLLNRVTKSSIIRIIGIEVGDMPKEAIGPHIQGIKSLIEQKSALDVGASTNEYTNPGPIENNIYVPTHNGVGAISTQEVGGDVNVTGLEDLNFFKNKFYAGLKIPKQYFGDTEDSAGFDGGTSLSLLSARYAKTIKRIQNTFIQAITDAVNLILLDKGLTTYVNKFQLHMVTPTTREELDRQDNALSKVSLASDIMMLVADIKDLSSRLRILKALLNEAISDPEVGQILQDEIDRLEELKEQGYTLDETGEIVSGPEGGTDETGLLGSLDSGSNPFEGSGDFSGGPSPNLDSLADDTPSPDDADSSMDLPSPGSLGIDFTDSDNM